MTISDSIADMLTRMRNAILVRHDFVLVPMSKMKLSITKILKEEGFITDYEVLRGKRDEIPRVYSGLGIALVSTPRGVMTGHRAWRQRVGGELLCYVW